MLRRRQARASLLDFTTYTKPDYQVNWHHRVLCEYLDKFVSGEIRRLMVFAPPRHGKSELVSRRLPAYIHGRFPDVPIIACSYSASLAHNMNRDVQRIIRSLEYQKLFPETQLFGSNVRTVADDTYLRNCDQFEIVGHRGVYVCAGVNGPITGKGFDYGIIDDPIKNEEEAYSKTVREKIWNWWGSTFYTRAEESAAILLTMTRWHRDDLAGRIEREALEHGDWTIIRFPAVVGGDVAAYDPRGPGEALWPGKYDQAALEDIHDTVGPTKWAAMYQQEPRAEGGSEWPEACFGPEIWFDEWPTDLYLKAAALDPSKGKGDKWGDYSAFVWGGVDPEGTLWIDADLANDRNCSVMVDQALDLQRRFHPDWFAVETNMFQELIADDMIAKSMQQNIDVPVAKIVNKANKKVRIRRLTPWLMQRKIRFKGGSKGAKMLVEQLQDFPNGDHDDGPDALEMLYHALYVARNGTSYDGLGDRLPGMGV